MPKQELPQLLCKSGLPSGDYDDLIKDHIKTTIYAIMTESRGFENPLMVIERIKKVVGKFNYSVFANEHQPRELVELSDDLLKKLYMEIGTLLDVGIKDEQLSAAADSQFKDIVREMMKRKISLTEGNEHQPRESVELSGTDENFHEFIEDEPDILETHELFNADPTCNHEVYSAPGGGVKCKHCPGWFCF